MMASSQDTARYFDPPGSLNLKIKPGFKESDSGLQCVFTIQILSQETPAITDKHI
ncbi:MAG: hypothetical protein IPG99_14840 [Ignavibacteria bacterium]|nr:hypothetical protein [Ignavibacteria bacterium]